MIRHHVLMVLKEDSREVADQIVAELAAYAPTCEHIRDYKVGRDLGLTPGAADVALVAEFDDVEGYQAYSADAGHVEIIQRLIVPNADQVIRSQTEF